jgi:hypothetical protein
MLIRGRDVSLEGFRLERSSGLANANVGGARLVAGI